MIIVNFSTDAYKRPAARLEQSLQGHNYLMFKRYDDIGSPTHQQSPYEFKIHAIRAASVFDQVVLWVDSSMYRVGDLSVIEEIIKRDGFFGEEAGHYTARWTNQFTRNYFNLTESELKQEPGGMIMFSAGLLGLDFSNPLANEFFTRWEQAAKAGCFKGDWSDHRHDMTCASIIAQRIGFKYQTGGTHLAYIGPGYSEPKRSVIFYAQGMHG